MPTTVILAPRREVKLLHPAPAGLTVYHQRTQEPPSDAAQIDLGGRKAHFILKPFSGLSGRHQRVLEANSRVRLVDGIDLERNRGHNLPRPVGPRQRAAVPQPRLK